MKPVFKCDYCKFMGTEEEVREHEPNCFDNFDMKSCLTCKNRGKLTMEESKIKYECKKGRDVPAGKIYQNCDLYERKEKSQYGDIVDTLFGGLF